MDAESAVVAIDLDPLILGIEEMDATHREFVDLVNRMQQAKGNELRRLFHELMTHMELHIGRENHLMKQSGFPARLEHHSEHLRILGQLAHFRMRVDQGQEKMARAFICEQLPEWFRTHVPTMDSALAAHLKQNGFRRSA